jgi:thiol-disulfide isomerase/thioredoxin
MKSALKSVLLVSTLLALASTSEGGDGHEAHSTKLITHTEESFFSDVMNPSSLQLVNGPWFIMFYAPWCGHCKRLMPLWDQFAEEHGDRINIGRVDCDADTSRGLCSQFDITGYPTLLYLKDSRVFRYRGERSINGFLQFTDGQGYQEAESDDLPRKLEGFELYQKQF